MIVATKKENRQLDFSLPLKKIKLPRFYRIL